jgi:hypothetical protein
VAAVIFHGGDDAAGVQLTVSRIAITIFYTTPARTAGRLTLSWTNASDSSVQCVESFNVFAESFGTATGLHDGAGDWSIDDYTLSYMQSATHPSCPGCNCTIADYPGGHCGTDCCAEGFEPPARLAIGSFGGLTDDACLSCEQVAGTYILDPGCSLTDTGTVI